MQWLPPSYRILYCDNCNMKIYNKLKTYKEQGSLFCMFNDERVALVTDIELEDKIKFVIYELKPGALSKINYQDYYIELDIKQQYLDWSIVEVSNILTIKSIIK